MTRLLNSFKFAFRGFWVAVKEQSNLRIHLVVSLFVVLVAYLLRVQTIEWLILLICIALVISLELVNSAIEGLVDLVSAERLPLAGKIKDMAAAAVLVAAVIASWVGVVIFGPYLLSYV